MFEIGDIRKQLHKENAKLTGQLWCSKAVIYVNNYKKETCVEKTGAIKFIERQDIFVNQLYLVFYSKHGNSHTGKTLYAIHVNLCYTSSNMDKIYAKRIFSASSGDPLTIAAMT